MISSKFRYKYSYTFKVIAGLETQMSLRYRCIHRKQINTYLLCATLKFFLTRVGCVLGTPGWSIFRGVSGRNYLCLMHLRSEFAFWFAFWQYFGGRLAIWLRFEIAF